MDDVNEYERQRQENILKNKALLLQLQLDAASVSATKKGASKSGSANDSKPKKRIPKKEPETPVPRRTSSRLAGIPADSEVAKRKYENAAAELEEANRAKKARVAGDLSFDLKQGLVDVTKGTRYQRTFTDDDVKETTNKGLRAMREKMMGLKLYEKHGISGRCIGDKTVTFFF